MSVKTSQCLNPTCSRPNPHNKIICQYCKSRLLLVNRYRAVSQIGSGGFARIYQAIDEYFANHSCIIKQFCPLKPNSTTYQKSLALFEQEALILEELGQHPQIPTLFASCEQDGYSYIVQEFIEGINLYKQVKQNGALNEMRVRGLLEDLLPILQFIHDRQILHRDIKPSNIIQRPNGSIVLIDFGSCQRLGTQFAKTPIAGTPGYAAPEQLQGKASISSDLYSLGVTSIRLLSGCFPNEQDDTLLDPQQKRWRWREKGISVTQELERVLERLLQEQPGDRFESATEVLRALKGSRRERYSSHAATLKSSQRGDSSKLKDLLAAGNYREADRETWLLMLHIARREREGCLNLNAIEQFPEERLEQIDRLWQDCSKGRFGFSIQKQIYQSLGGSRGFDYELWKKFGERIGWYANNNWLNYSDLTFSASALPGHLPACFADVLNRAGVERGVCGWWRLGFVSLVQKLDESEDRRGKALNSRSSSQNTWLAVEKIEVENPKKISEKSSKVSLVNILGNRI
jgi:serine/threonine protein kinase